MKKLVLLNLAALVTNVVLIALLVSNARSAHETLADVATTATIKSDAATIREQMTLMSDAMRGFLLDPSNQGEYQRKKAADARLVETVETLLDEVSDNEYRDLIREIGALDEQQLDPLENRILDETSRDPKQAAHIYLTEYVPIRQEQSAIVDRLQKKSEDQFTSEVQQAEVRLTRTATLAMWVGGFILSVMLAAFALSARTTYRMSARISQNTGSLSAAAGGVLSASAQMAQSAHLLSSGATEQAASLEETSASMEEMAAMTRRNAQNAQNAAQLVEEVAGRVRSSNTALQEMVTSMSAIKESSHKVANIIKTIDEIAFQTNILALNAAVEAARAGEAGMGFAVVADEVRNLAQRSAQAAKDTALLIEESISRSQDGASRVEQVATAISAITGSVEEVRSIVLEVREASSQQTSGIEQVSQAIVAMEKATQTTAATAEESAAASEELKSQAEQSMSVVRELGALVGNREQRAGSAPAQSPAKVTAMRPPAPVVATLRPAQGSAPRSRRTGPGKTSARGDTARPLPQQQAEELFPLGDTGTYGQF
jgi:methyl-accepting chemotaxis protein/methyl-accepting chemotaxis protein-1 (serine sensor receptor)